MSTLKCVSQVIAASTIGLTVLSTASAAHAFNLVPPQEGELKLTNLECLSTTNPKCLDTSVGQYGYTVTSLNFDPQFSESRLFADKRGTANDYSAFGIKFLADDEGTNPSAFQEYWLRPVAYTAPVTTTNIKNADNDPKFQLKPETKYSVATAQDEASINYKTTSSLPTIDNKGNTTTTEKTTQIETKILNNVWFNIKENKLVPPPTKPNSNIIYTSVKSVTTTNYSTKTTTVTPPKPVETGRLEVGKFQFDFKNPLSGLEFSFFDVEDSNHTGILSYTNSLGKTFSINELLAGGQNGNRQSLILKDVQSFVVQLGNPGTKYGYLDSNFSTGDGANLQLETVPEPGMVGGLGALAMLGMISKRQRKNKVV